MKELKDITASILAGGLGTRLRPVIVDQPKALVWIHNQPFLSYLLNQLDSFGLRKVVLCTGYLGEKIASNYGLKYNNLDLIYSQEESPLGTGGALRLALPHIESDTTLVLNGDSFCDVNLDRFWKWHYDKNSQASLCLTQVPDPRRFGHVERDENEAIISFVEKRKNSSSGLINAGVYLINCGLISEIPIGTNISLEKEVFPTWIGKGFYGYHNQGKFLDIGIPASLKQAEYFFEK